MSCSTLRVYFVHRHMRDTVVILDEGSNPIQSFPKCDMFIIWRALNSRHHVMTMCSRGGGGGGGGGGGSDDGKKRQG